MVWQDMPATGGLLVITGALPMGVPAAPSHAWPFPVVAPDTLTSAAVNMANTLNLPLGIVAMALDLTGQASYQLGAQWNQLP